MKLKNEVQEVTVTGLVKAVEWDESGSACQVSILTENEEEYFVSPKGMGRELLELEQSEVEVTGKFKKDKGGNNTIIVNKYKIISQTPWEEEETEDYYPEEV